MNLNRFTILHDSYFALDTYSTVKTISVSKADKTHIYYNSTTGNVTDSDENAQYLLFISDTASGATSPSAVYDYKLGFVDN